MTGVCLSVVFCENFLFFFSPGFFDVDDFDEVIGAAV
jgi:hypothetical protein